MAAAVARGRRGRGPLDSRRPGPGVLIARDGDVFAPALELKAPTPEAARDELQRLAGLQRDWRRRGWPVPPETGWSFAVGERKRPGQGRLKAASTWEGSGFHSGERERAEMEACFGARLPADALLTPEVLDLADALFSPCWRRRQSHDRQSLRGHTPESFDPNAVRLDDGVMLLEASAGTGKTFALAHLVLRLLAERRLGLRQLLVVTYTNAAAAELRDRIGRRIQEALTGLQPPPAGGRRPVLAQWLERQPGEAGARGTVQGLLLLALEELDAADITTIHGFCQRTLRRQAMEAARPPDLTLETDAAELVRQVAHDYWQQQVLALPLHLVEGLAASAGLEDLERLLQLLDGDPGLVLAPCRRA